MKSKELALGIFLYDDIILPEKNKIFNLNDWQQEYVMDKYGNISLNKNERSTSSVTIPYNNSKNELSNIFKKTFDPIENDYSKIYGLNLKGHSPYRILKYNTGDKFNLHTDDGGASFVRVSTLYYLNENFKGGDIVFPKFKIKISPKENQMLIFPSNYIYSHYVEEVTQGIRYSVASWIR